MKKIRAGNKKTHKEANKNRFRTVFLLRRREEYTTKLPRGQNSPRRRPFAVSRNNFQGAVPQRTPGGMEWHRQCTLTARPRLALHRRRRRRRCCCCCCCCGCHYDLHHERGRRATMPIRDGRRRCSHLLVATAAALNWH